MTAKQMAPKDFAKLVRTNLRRRGFTGRVRTSRGTSYGWIDIAGSGIDGEFTKAEWDILSSLDIHPAMNCHPISPDARDELLSAIA